MIVGLACVSDAGPPSSPFAELNPPRRRGCGPPSRPGVSPYSAWPCMVEVRIWTSMATPSGPRTAVWRDWYPDG